MVERICGIIHNFFTKNEDKHKGTYVIENGAVELSFLANGQYFRIIGSALNDGVYQYPATDLADETFTGEIWAMNVPNAVKEVAAEAADLSKDDEMKKVLNSPYTSESVIGAYSYSKGAGASGGAYSWLFGKNGVYAPILDPYRRLSERV